jgi:hypothetical protein
MKIYKNPWVTRESYCELRAEWMNVDLGDCLGNCESEEGKLWNV